MATILEEEIELARRLLSLVLEDSRIGYEPACHYFYTANDLMEKVVNCEFLQRRYGLASESMSCAKNVSSRA